MQDKKITIWVPRSTKQFIEDGVLKAACPQGGHIEARVSLLV
jgi:hypothetical protein